MIESTLVIIVNIFFLQDALFSRRICFICISRASLDWADRDQGNSNFVSRIDFSGLG